MMPIAASVSMSLMLPESTNSFMAAPDQIRGASPPRTPLAFARGAPRSPLRSGGRARGAPSPLLRQQQRVQSSRFEPHNGLVSPGQIRARLGRFLPAEPAFL